VAMFAVGGEIYTLDGLGIFLLGGGAVYSPVWRSKKFAFPHAVGFGWMRASGPIAEPVTVRLYVDGALIHTATLTNREPVRLPAKKGMRWEIELESEGPVTSITLAQAQPELFE
jgi:hypothetical protein